MGFLIPFFRKIMFLYPSRPQRMKADGEEKAEKEIDDCLRSEKIPDSGNEDGFGCPIDRYPFVKGFDLAEPGDAKDLEQGVEEQPHAFADKVVVDQPRFPAVGQVGVELVYTLEGMVFDMVTFERDRAGKELRQVGQNAGESVGCAALEKQVMCAFVDHNEKRMVGKSAEQIRRADNEPPRASSKQPGHGTLEKNEAEDSEDRILVLSDEPSHFGVLLQDLFGTETVRLLFIGIDEVGSS